MIALDMEISQKPRFGTKRFPEESRIRICDVVKVTARAAVKRIVPRQVVEAKLTADAGGELAPGAADWGKRGLANLGAGFRISALAVVRCPRHRNWCQGEEPCPGVPLVVGYATSWLQVTPVFEPPDQAEGAR